MGAIFLGYGYLREGLRSFLFLLGAAFLLYTPAASETSRLESDYSIQETAARGELKGADALLYVPLSFPCVTSTESTTRLTLEK
jgi:hypothetical protein